MVRREKVAAAIKQAKLKEELPDMKLEISASKESDIPADSSSGLSDLNAEVN